MILHLLKIINHQLADDYSVQPFFHQTNGTFKINKLDPEKFPKPCFIFKLPQFSMRWEI